MLAVTHLERVPGDEKVWRGLDRLTVLAPADAGPVPLLCETLQPRLTPDVDDLLGWDNIYKRRDLIKLNNIFFINYLNKFFSISLFSKYCKLTEKKLFKEDRQKYFLVDLCHSHFRKLFLYSFY